MADGSDDDLGDGIKGYRYLSCDINDGISVTIDKVYGRLPVSFQLKDSPLLHVTAFLLAADEPIVMETVTRNAKYDEARGVCQWGEELHFGARVKDLPKGAVLACTVWQSIAVSDCVVPIAAGVLPLTTASEKLRSGPQRLRLAPSRIANPNNACELPGKIPANEKGELERLEALKKRYDRGEFNECTWLDNLSLCYMSTLEVRGFVPFAAFLLVPTEVEPIFGRRRRWNGGARKGLLRCSSIFPCLISLSFTARRR